MDDLDARSGAGRLRVVRDTDDAGDGEGQGVVFDMDGIIVDSEDDWHEARREFVEQHGGGWTEEDQRAVMGANSSQWARHIRDNFGVDLTEAEIIEEVVRLLQERYAEGLPLIAGATEAVRSAAAEYRLAVASSSPRTVIEYVLDRTGLESSFDAYVSSDEVDRGKPAPDVYLVACDRLEIRPERAVAVEDSANGIRAAKAAGMRVIAVPNPSFPPEEEALGQADSVVDAVRDVTPALIRSALGGSATEARA